MLIHLIPQPALKNYILAVVLLVILVAQAMSNAKVHLYRIGGYTDFRLVAKIIHDDDDFMHSNKTIYTSSDLFHHYLEADGISTTNLTVLDKNNPPDTFAPSFNNVEFYYLEYLPYDRDLLSESHTFQALSAQYKIRCMTNMKKIRVMKFSRDASAVTTPLQDCRNNLTDVPFLK